MLRYTITADKPQDIVSALRSAVKKMQDNVKARQPGTTGIKKSANLAGEVSALDSVLYMLDNVDINGPLMEPFVEKEEAWSG